MLNQHTQKLKKEFMDTSHVNKHSYFAICVIYGCGYESSTQTKFTYYNLKKCIWF